MNRLIVLISLTVLFAGCSTPSSIQDFTGKEKIACAYPDDLETEAPSWVCNVKSVNGDPAAVGSYPKAGNGHEFQYTMATGLAQAKLASQIVATISQNVMYEARDNGEEDERLTERASVSTQIITENPVFSTTVERVAKNPETGVLYVLVSIDRKTYEKLHKIVVNNYKKQASAIN